eukprot:jgi/Botrbrau1/21670/Bobra.43_1s0068.1
MAGVAESEIEPEGSDLLQALGVTAVNVAAVERDVLSRAVAENAGGAIPEEAASDDAGEQAGPGRAPRSRAGLRLRAVEREAAAVRSALETLDQQDEAGPPDEDAWSSYSDSGSASEPENRAPPGPAAPGERQGAAGEDTAPPGRQGLEEQRQLQRAVLNQRLADLEARQDQLEAHNCKGGGGSCTAAARPRGSRWGRRGVPP